MWCIDVVVCYDDDFGGLKMFNFFVVEVEDVGGEVVVVVYDLIDLVLCVDFDVGVNGCWLVGYVGVCFGVLCVFGCIKV